VTGERKSPVLLTPAEALDYAARQLLDMAQGCDLAAMVLELRGAAWMADAPAEARAKFADLSQMIPEPKLQAAACRSAARVIQELSLEERLVAARVAAQAAEKTKGAA
jgi:hypothetical protein